jgi:acyl-CoA synthetase (AMP-forming)/AMP-acid ligase II
VLRPGAEMTTEALIGFCRERLSGYKVPKSVEFRTSLPHTEIGKLNKLKLKEMIIAEMAKPENGQGKGDPL